MSFPGDVMLIEVEQVTPIAVSDEELAQWSREGSAFFTLALRLSKFIPRGKDFFPRWMGRLLGKNDKFAIRTARGAFLAVDPDNWDVFTRMILGGGTWDRLVIEACIGCLHPGDVFYDLGANVGYMSIEAASLFQDTIKICAFEPQPNLAHVAAISARLNNFRNVSIYDIMLGQEEGTANLFIPTHCIHASSISRESNARSITCRVEALDELVSRGNIPPPDLVKIDVEGGELNVFHGMKNIIQGITPYIIFEADDNMDRFGYNREDLINYLLSLADYQFFHIIEKGFFPINRAEINQIYTADILAVPKARPIPNKLDLKNNSSFGPLNGAELFETIGDRSKYGSKITKIG
jgi:FkbM family methyltransferase